MNPRRILKRFYKELYTESTKIFQGFIRNSTRILSVIPWGFYRDSEGSVQRIISGSFKDCIRVTYRNLQGFSRDSRKTLIRTSIGFL